MYISFNETFNSPTHATFHIVFYFKAFKKKGFLIDTFLELLMYENCDRRFFLISSGYIIQVKSVGKSECKKAQIICNSYCM